MEVYENACWNNKNVIKGQIVIPRDIREEIHAGEGTAFAVISGKNSVILKKIETPSKEDLIKDLEKIAKKGKKRAKKLGIKQGDVLDLFHRRRWWGLQ